MKKPSVVIMTVLVVGVGVWLTVRQVQINQDRARFMQAKTNLHMLAKQISAANQPAEETATQSCTYQSRVYGRGPRSCAVDEYIVVHLSGKPGQRVIDSARQVIESSTDFSSPRLLEPYDDRDSTSGYQELARDVFTGEGFSCNADYYAISTSFPLGTPGNLKLQPSLLVRVTCGGGAKAEYFSVK